MKSKDKNKNIHSENNKNVRRAISQPTKATSKLVNSVSGGKGIKSDYKAYQRATKMDHIDNKYRRTYKREQKKYNDSKNYQSKTSNGSKTHYEVSRHNESPAERQARSRAAQGRDESRSGNLKTQSEQTKISESKRQDNINSYSKTSTKSSNDSSIPRLQEYSSSVNKTNNIDYHKSNTSSREYEENKAIRNNNEYGETKLKTSNEYKKNENFSNTNKNTSNTKSYSPADRYADNVARQGLNESGGSTLKTATEITNIQNKSYSPADKYAENIARQGRNESGGVVLKTQESTGSMTNNLSQNTKTSNSKIIANSERLNSEGPQTGAIASSTVNSTSERSTKRIGNPVNDKLNENSNIIKTANESGLLPIQIQDETGQTITLNVGESIMLDNGSLIGYAIDENGEGFIFSNFYDKSDVSGLGNTITTKGHKNGLRAKGAEVIGLNEHANVGNVTGGMTLKTGVAEVNGVIDVDDFINSDGTRIITVNMGDNKKVNKLGTLISKNDQTKNKKLTLNDKDIKKLKTKAKVLFGATVIVRGASFVGNKTIGIVSMMFDGMGSDKAEVEFMIDQVSGKVKGKAKSLIKKGTVKTGKTVGKVLAKGIGKVSKYGAKASAWGLNHFKFGRKITNFVGNAVNKFKTVKKLAGVVGRAMKAFSMALKKYIIIALACCIFMFCVCGLVGGAGMGVSSMFGFLFKEPETLFEKYHNYISEVDGMVTALNNDFSKNHKMPLYGNDLTESNGGNLDGYDWANVDDTTKKRTGYDANSYAYKQDYALPNGPTSQHDQQGGLISKSPIADTPTFSGKISGVNWRAFLSCVQVYNGFANDLEETNSKDRESAEKKQKEYDAYDTDNINPYGRFKDEWKSKNSNFVKPKLDVSVDCYYLESVTNNKWDNDLNKTDDEGDKKFDEYVRKLQQYYNSKEAVDKYNAEKALYDSNMVNWNNLVKAYTSNTDANKNGEPDIFETYKSTCGQQNIPIKYTTFKKYTNAVKNDKLSWFIGMIKPVAPNVPSDLAYNQSVVSAGIPNEITKHYKLTYELRDEADYSLNTYSEWFKYAMYEQDSNGNAKAYELTKEDIEVLNSLYTSPDLFVSFDELYDSHVTQAMVTHTQECFARGILGVDYIIACNENGIAMGGNITTGEAIKVDPATLNDVQTKILSYAQSKLGCPYVWGAKGPNTFDCSGLVYWVYAQVGYNVPSSTAALASSKLKRVSLSELQPGDILLRRSGNSGHTGIYIGAGQYIHAPHTGDVVKVSSNVNSFQYALRVIESN